MPFRKTYSTKCALHPSFLFNLISAKFLTTHSNFCLIFFSNSCYVQDLSSWTTNGVGKVYDRLYHLQLVVINPSILCLFLSILLATSVANNASNFNFDQYTLWHCRFGQSSTIQHMLNDIDKATLKLSNTSKFFCEIFPLAKHHWLSFFTQKPKELGL